MIYQQKILDGTIKIRLDNESFWCCDICNEHHTLFELWGEKYNGGYKLWESERYINLVDDSELKKEVIDCFKHYGLDYNEIEDFNESPVDWEFEKEFT